ncbi:MAG: PHP domain-containing protein [Terrimicrobiaceae bacterium]
MFRFDLHVHSWYSPDAADRPEDLIAAAKSRGLHGIAITDHDTCRAHAYCLKAGLSHPNGLPVEDFLVVPGVEVSSADGHILCLGVLVDGLTGCPAAQVLREVRDRGGIAVPAHPFDGWRHGIGEAGMDALGPALETIEVFNSAVSSKTYNEKAAAYAQARQLTGLAGSDAHHASAVGTSHTELEMDTLDVPSLIAAIRKGGIPRGTYLSKAEAFKKHFANLFRKGTPPDDRD